MGERCDCEERVMPEKEYIEREAAYSIAKKVVDAIADGQYHAGVFGHDIMDWIDDIPAANVREVVLCRDCEYYQADCGWCGLLDIGMNVNGFCSRGVKREEN